jgi:hypothetical protein
MDDYNNALGRELDAKAAALHERILYRDEQEAPRNTLRNYKPKQDEWRVWCVRNAAPMPAVWPPTRQAPWEGALPGELVDENKLLSFMEEVVKRAPKSGKRVKEEKERSALKLEQALEGLTPSERREEELASELTLQYNSVRITYLPTYLPTNLPTYPLFSHTLYRSVATYQLYRNCMINR